MNFAHFRVRSAYAPMLGAVRTSDLISWAKESGVQHVIFSDPGTMHGAYQLQKAALSAGLTPVHAVELGGDILVALTSEGLRNLITESSHSQAGTPNSETWRGLLQITGAPGSTLRGSHSVPDMILEDIVSTSEHEIAIELQVGDEENWPWLAALAETHSLHLIPTADVRFGKFDQRLDYLLVEAIRSGQKLADVEGAPGEHLLSIDEMNDRFAEYPTALTDLETILEENTFPLLERSPDLWPEFPVPEGYTAATWLYEEMKLGLVRRFPEGISKEVKARVRYEYDIICSKNYPDYFLVMKDLVDWCSKNGIYTNTRGSAAGSMVSYILGITGLDPMKHRMVFERFLNPGRESPPDIDLDISQERRQEATEYLRNKWGADHVCQIGSLGTFNAKGSLRDAVRVLGYSYSLGERLSSAVPPMQMGREISLVECFDESSSRYEEAQAIRDIVESDVEAADVVEHAMHLNGLVRQTGIHAAGVIVSRAKIASEAPVMKKDNGPILSQWYWGETEAHGLLKLDLLGVRNLDVLANVLSLVEGETGIKLDPYKDIPLDDPETFELLRRGDTLGVFQLDGEGMRSLVRSMKPDKFDDLPACVALYRPGPMSVGSHLAYAKRKNGIEPLTPIHPELAEALEPVLGSTYNVIAYQEAVLEIAQVLAGYSLGEADILRRAIGKKSREVMEAEYGRFSDGARVNGYSDDAIEAVWGAIKGNSDYSFNRAHAVSYGWLAMVESYLKTHYPTLFMAGLLSTADLKHAPLYLRECRRMGVRVLPPSVRDSAEGYSVKKGAILVGIRAIKGIGADVADSIVAMTGNDYNNSLVDWITLAPPGARNKKTLEALIKAGAFSSTGKPRKALLAAVPAALAAGKSAAIAEEYGLPFFYPGSDIPVGTEELTRIELLNLEKEMFGLYVSDHPLSILAQNISELATHSIGELSSSSDKDQVRISGMISTLQKKTTKNGGKAWAIATIEDLDGTVDCLIFPSSWDEVATSVREGSIVVVDGRVSIRDGGVSLIPDSISVLDPEPSSSPLILRVPLRLASLETIEDVMIIGEKFPGEVPLEMVIQDGRSARLVRVMTVNACPELLLELSIRFGPQAVRWG